MKKTLFTIRYDFCVCVCFCVLHAVVWLCAYILHTVFWFGFLYFFVDFYDIYLHYICHYVHPDVWWMHQPTSAVYCTARLVG